MIALSKTEFKIFFLLGKGLCNKRISRITGTSVHTISIQCKSIFKKTGIQSRREVINLSEMFMFYHKATIVDQRADRVLVRITGFHYVVRGEDVEMINGARKGMKVSGETRRKVLAATKDALAAQEAPNPD